jgi:hypothetical protein
LGGIQHGTVLSRCCDRHDKDFVRSATRIDKDIPG